MTRDIPPGAELLTYAEAGERLGIDPDSVKRRAQRAQWVRIMGNDGRVRVAVPLDARTQGGDVTGDVAPPPEPMAALMERLTERAIAAEARAAAAEATVAAQASELRRWVRRSPAKHPAVVLRRLDKLAKGGSGQTP